MECCVSNVPVPYLGSQFHGKAPHRKVYPELTKDLTVGRKGEVPSWQMFSEVKRRCQGLCVFGVMTWQSPLARKGKINVEDKDVCNVKNEGRFSPHPSVHTSH
uniref:Uncharacterized protein n=1 Tax=Trieres chinensis TaxID=1514140 RepID=A0A7S2EG10_TRICV|mmetsp:Transcript_21420/g.43260  ORF Transcript_21420/g.43260 Transcript_21420/m.43260 type:complete len:103 (+) Transcript_21420:578-886(+)